jgi:hypothetical protein
MDTQNKGCWSWIHRARDVGVGHRARAVGDGYTELGQLELETQI